MKPRILDLFCGAGGAAMGLHRAGFEVVGVDIEPQKNYPFEFHQADAMTYPLEDFDAYWASPPCQFFSKATPEKARKNHPDLIEPTRARLAATGSPWIIENVVGAPIRADIRLTGDMVGLPLIKRERWFETNWFDSIAMTVRTPRKGLVITVAGHGTPSWSRKSWGRNIRIEEKRAAMGIDWMNRDELSQAIPPAYSEYIGLQLMKVLT